MLSTKSASTELNGINLHHIYPFIPARVDNVHDQRTVSRTALDVFQRVRLHLEGTYTRRCTRLMRAGSMQVNWGHVCAAKLVQCWWIIYPLEIFSIVSCVLNCIAIVVFLPTFTDYLYLWYFLIFEHCTY